MCYGWAFGGSQISIRGLLMQLRGFFFNIKTYIFLIFWVKYCLFFMHKNIRIIKIDFILKNIF